MVHEKLFAQTVSEKKHLYLQEHIVSVDIKLECFYANCKDKQHSFHKSRVANESKQVAAFGVEEKQALISNDFKDYEKIIQKYVEI